jgi:tRNA (guanine37-N1)-methyltransferase
MNLPATALSFLPSFVGLYIQASIPRGTPLPKIHVYCFSTKSEDNVEQAHSICAEISKQLGCEMAPGDGEKEGEVKVWDVRDVAPNKRMFCASFVLPGSVAWREGGG